MRKPILSAQKRLRPLLLATLFLPMACNSTREANECPELIGYDPDNAASDAARAVDAGERYLLGVYGIASEYPGVVRTDLPLRMIEHTSDHECVNLNARTRDYARRFNLEMQARLAPPPRKTMR